MASPTEAFAPVILVFTLLGLVTAIVRYIFFSPGAKVRRALRRARRIDVKDVAEGGARVTGTAKVQADVLLAPMSRRRCLAYELRVYGTDGHSDWWDVLVLREACVFSVVDDTGAIEVDPNGQFELALVKDLEGGTGRPKSDAETLGALARLLETSNVEDKLRRGPMHFEEGVLEEGERVSVYGHVEREVRAEGERAELRSPPEFRVLRGNEEWPLKISDAPAVASSTS